MRNSLSEFFYTLFFPRLVWPGTLIFFLSLNTGCTSVQLSNRLDSASATAKSGNLQPFTLSTPPYVLSAWGRVTNANLPVRLYIEGDGLAWLGRHTPAPNPTPKNPVGLALAAADNGPNVVYLARPCQFTAPDYPGNSCQLSDWTWGRFNPQIIAAFDQALALIREQYSVSRFELVGYSGGAYIAGLLAAQRKDVVSWRSVAGNLDNDFFVKIHNVSPMPQADDLADKAVPLADLPQIHFIAADDTQVPATIAYTYQQHLPHQRCTQIIQVPDTTHAEGWAQAWAHLVMINPTCSQSAPSTVK